MKRILNSKNEKPILGELKIKDTAIIEANKLMNHKILSNINCIIYF